MLILVGILPSAFSLNPASKPQDIQQIVTDARSVQSKLDAGKHSEVKGEDSTVSLSDFLKTKGVATDRTFDALAGKNHDILDRLQGKSSFGDLSVDQRTRLRSDIYLMSETINKLVKAKKIADPAEAKTFSAYSAALSKETKYIPVWVKFAVAIALGLGTMIGWKRIVVTVGEKIGKEHLTYAQGASAEIVAMITIASPTGMECRSAPLTFCHPGSRAPWRQTGPDCRWIHCEIFCWPGC